MELADEDLPLERAYRWERERAARPFLTQPLGDGSARTWSWAAGLDEARRVAAWLKAQEWEPGARVAILARNSAWWILADLAVWMAGHVSVPIYPSLLPDAVRQLLEHSEARACFVGAVDDAAALSAAIPSGVRRIALPTAAAELAAPPPASPSGALPPVAWERIIADTAPLLGRIPRGGDELATIIYTSGTTGTPKGVMHRFAAFGFAARAFAASVKHQPGDRGISYLPLAHVAERALVEATTLYLGTQLFFVARLETFLDDLRRARPTAFFSVPRLWTRFQQGVFAKQPKDKLDRLMRIPLLGRLVKRRILRELGLDSVRYASVGAAPMPAELLTWYRNLGLELLEGYAMTENFALSHGSRVGETRVGYVGHPFDGVEVRLGDGGEVLVKSPGNMLGYYKEPELTRAALGDDGFLRTGDLGELDDAGRLRITGRAKEQFKTSKGKFVSPAPIENLLAAHEKIEAVCVTGVGFPQPFAIVMLAVGEWQRARDASARRALGDSLAAHLEAVNTQLPAHERLDFLAVVPDAWTIENGLLTPTLKIKRPLLEAAYQPYFEAWARAEQPVVWHEAPMAAARAS